MFLQCRSCYWCRYRWYCCWKDRKLFGFYFRQNDRLHSSPAVSAACFIIRTNCFNNSHKYIEKKGDRQNIIYCKYIFFQMTVLHIFHYVFHIVCMNSSLKWQLSNLNINVRLMYFNILYYAMRILAQWWI